MNCVTQTHMPKAKLSTRTEPKPEHRLLLMERKQELNRKLLSLRERFTERGPVPKPETKLKYFILTKR